MKRREVRYSALGTILVLVLLASRPAASGAAAIVEGTVELPDLDVPAPMPNPRYQIKTAAPVGPPDPQIAVVYLEGAFPGPPPEAEMAQHHYQFAPGLLPIRRGALVRFPNLDDEYHSVFSYSKTKRFDLGRYHKEETPAALTFDQPGPVRLFCEIHDHMRGTILVLDTPHFVRTTTDGRYRLEGLPAGHFLLKAWLDEETVRQQAVELRDGEMLRVDFPAH